MYYNCGGRGHTSRQCFSEDFFCDTRGAKKTGEHCDRRPEVKKTFVVRGLLKVNLLMTLCWILVVLEPW